MEAFEGQEEQIQQGLETVSTAVYEAFDVAAGPHHAEQSFTYLNLYTGSMRDPAFELSRDGIHPSAQGHQWIYDRVVPVFDGLVV